MLELMPLFNRNVTYNPFRDMEEMEKRMFGENGVFSFKTDIKDNGDSFLLEAELPGFNKSDIEVNIDNDYLTIKAERKMANDEKDKNGRYVRCERSYGSFRRSFDISDIDAEKIEATYENGVLALKMPKKAKEIPTSKKLEIQ